MGALEGAGFAEGVAVGAAAAAGAGAAAVALGAPDFPVVEAGAPVVEGAGPGVVVDEMVVGAASGADKSKVGEGPGPPLGRGDAGPKADTRLGAVLTVTFTIRDSTPP